MSSGVKVILVIFGLLLLLPGLCGALAAIGTISDLIFGNSGSDMDVTGAVIVMAPLGLICGGFGIWMLLKVVRDSRSSASPDNSDSDPS